MIGWHVGCRISLFAVMPYILYTAVFLLMRGRADGTPSLASCMLSRILHLTLLWCHNFVMPYS